MDQVTADTVYIDLNDRDRNQVQQRARVARLTLDVARRMLTAHGYQQVRFDQYQHPKTRVMVETGYTYGESRLVVHHPKAAGPVDFRLVGGDTNKTRYDEFKDLTGLV